MKNSTTRTVFVLHMVIESVSNDKKEITIAFVNKEINYISEKLRKCLDDFCEVQLIPVTTPHKYMFMYNYLSNHKIYIGDHTDA